MSEEKKKSLVDILKEAQAKKSNTTIAKNKKEKKEKIKSQVNNNRPTKRASGRGG